MKKELCVKSANGILNIPKYKIFISGVPSVHGSFELVFFTILRLFSLRPTAFLSDSLLTIASKAAAIYQVYSFTGETRL